ncbi:MAG: hypothetical protein LBJ93_00915 [Clostridiales bacterium]|nr:hypothetical protein [Clostridiales bacterium]
MKALLVNDDERYFYAQKYLESHGVNFVNDFTNKNPIDFILFNFRNKLDENIFDDNFFLKLTNQNKQVKVFSGIEHEYLNIQSKKNNFSYVPLINIKSIAILNSVPTSEGVIGYLINNLNKTIWSSKILVIGYGNCGKTISKKLLALGSKTYIYTKSKSNYAKAETDNIKCIYNKNDIFKKNFDVIINTAPTKIFEDNEIELLNSDVSLIDITYVGFNLDIAKKKNKISNRLLGIPAKVAPKTSGELLAKHILDLVGERNE